MWKKLTKKKGDDGKSDLYGFRTYKNHPSFVMMNKLDTVLVESGIAKLEQTSQNKRILANDIHIKVSATVRSLMGLISGFTKDSQSFEQDVEEIMETYNFVTDRASETTEFPMDWTTYGDDERVYFDKVSTTIRDVESFYIGNSDLIKQTFNNDVDTKQIHKNILELLNRLSKLYFVLARMN